VNIETRTDLLNQASAPTMIERGKRGGDSRELVVASKVLEQGFV